MTKVEEYLKSKKVKERKEPLDYDTLNRNIKKCKYCGELFHPSGLPKHEQYCSKNPNGKKGYKTKRKWECRYCKALFLHQKERDLHESRCEKIIENDIEIDNFDKLRLLRKILPEIYDLLSPEQIKDYLNGDN